jgi:NADH:ubiquinone oxidoreductase subunit E
VGCCALAPVVVVDDEVHPKNSPGKIKEIIEKYKGKNA